jgi:hypothetical protein
VYTCVKGLAEKGGGVLSESGRKRVTAVGWVNLAEITVALIVHCAHRLD